MRGKFIVLEGIDGSGKSTQSKRLSEWLEEITHTTTICTYEPNIFREILLTSKISRLTELLIFLADRSEHTARVILPSLEAGNNVICERWNASTLAYQNTPAASSLIALCKFPEPDAEIYLDITPEEAVKRIKHRGKLPDKFESQGLQYLNEVLSRYRKISHERSMIEVKCDGKSEEEIFQEIAFGLETRIWQSK